jgi:hypothetical protein
MDLKLLEKGNNHSQECERQQYCGKVTDKMVFIASVYSTITIITFMPANLKLCTHRRCVLKFFLLLLAVDNIWYIT